MSAQPSLYTGPDATPLMQASQCQATAESLEKHLEDSNYGKNKGIFLCYFKEGMPPRCVACGETIAAHPREHPNRPPLQQSATATASPNNTSERSPQEKAKREAWDPSWPKTNSVGPQCSFCLTIEDVNDKFTQLVEYEYNRLIMEPIPFNDEKQMTKYYFHLDGAPIQCDECLTEFPGWKPSATNPNAKQDKEKSTAFYAQHPTLQCCTCKYCPRKVCSHCIQKDLHKAENSRFNSSVVSAREWKTDLYDCCSSPKHTMNALACYYCYMHGASAAKYKIAFSPAQTRRNVEPLKHDTWLHTVFCPVFSLLVPAIAIPMDFLCCCSTFLVSALEVDFQRRYGLPHQGRSTLCFCRHCAFIRMIREAEERGYPQHTWSTRPSDVESMVSQHPPLHPSTTSRSDSQMDVELHHAAPPVQASMY